MLRVPFTRKRTGFSNTPSKKPGEIGSWLAAAKQSACHASCEETLTVDIATVEAVNSRELGEIAKLQLALREQGKRLVLANARQQIFEVFDITRMNRLVDVRPDARCPAQ